MHSIFRERFTPHERSWKAGWLGDVPPHRWLDRTSPDPRTSHAMTNACPNAPPRVFLPQSFRSSSFSYLHSLRLSFLACFRPSFLPTFFPSVRPSFFASFPSSIFRFPCSFCVDVYSVFCLVLPSSSTCNPSHLGGARHAAQSGFARTVSITVLF